MILYVGKELLDFLEIVELAEPVPSSGVEREFLVVVDGLSSDDGLFLSEILLRFSFPLLLQHPLFLVCHSLDGFFQLFVDLCLEFLLCHLVCKLRPLLNFGIFFLFLCILDCNVIFVSKFEQIRELLSTSYFQILYN